MDNITVERQIKVSDCPFCCKPGHTYLVKEDMGCMTVQIWERWGVGCDTEDCPGGFDAGTAYYTHEDAAISRWDCRCCHE